MCSLRDAATQLGKLSATVYGISCDDVASIAAFRKQQKLEFTLLSDPDGNAARKFSVLMAGRPYAKRVTFILDEQGIVRHITDKVNVMSHGTQIAELLTKLQAASK